MMEAPQSYAPPSNSGTEEGSPSSLGSSASGSAMHLAAAGEPYDDHSGSYPSNHHKQHHPDFSNNSPSAGSGSFSNASPAASPRSPSQKFQALRMWTDMQENFRSIEHQDKRKGLRRIKNCFSGADAVTHMLNFLHARPEERFRRAKRENAAILAQKLLDEGFFVHAVPGAAGGFVDSDKTFFALADSKRESHAVVGDEAHSSPALPKKSSASSTASAPSPMSALMNSATSSLAAPSSPHIARASSSQGSSFSFGRDDGPTLSLAEMLASDSRPRSSSIASSISSASQESLASTASVDSSGRPRTKSFASGAISRKGRKLLGRMSQRSSQMRKHAHGAGHGHNHAHFAGAHPARHSHAHVHHPPRGSQQGSSPRLPHRTSAQHYLHHHPVHHAASSAAAEATAVEPFRRSSSPSFESPVASQPLRPAPTPRAFPSPLMREMRASEPAFAGNPFPSSTTAAPDFTKPRGWSTNSPDDAARVKEMREHIARIRREIALEQILDSLGVDLMTFLADQSRHLYSSQSSTSGSSSLSGGQGTSGLFGHPLSCIRGGVPDWLVTVVKHTERHELNPEYPFHSVTIFDSEGKTVVLKTLDECHGVVRKFLLHLPEPVLPRPLTEVFAGIGALLRSRHRRSRELLRMFFSLLPDRNQSLLAFLLEHWAKLVDSGVVPGLTPRVLAEKYCGLLVGRSSFTRETLASCNVALTCMIARPKDYTVLPTSLEMEAVKQYEQETRAEARALAEIQARSNMTPTQMLNPSSPWSPLTPSGLPGQVKTPVDASLMTPTKGTPNGAGMGTPAGTPAGTPTNPAAGFAGTPQPSTPVMPAGGLGQPSPLPLETYAPGVSHSPLHLENDFSPLSPQRPSFNYHKIAQVRSPALESLLVSLSTDV